jgi:hypothetical protein
MEAEPSSGSSSHAPAGTLAREVSATSVDEGAEGATEFAVLGIAVPAANTSKLARRADVLLRRGFGVNTWFVVAVFIAVGLVFSLAIRGMRSRRTPDFEQFWNQVATADGPVQICFGAIAEPNATAPGLPLTLTAFQTAKRITDLLDQRNKSYMSIVRMLGPAATDLSQFPGGPIVFFGPWEPIAPIMWEWRYRFEPDEDGSTVWIVDAQSPGKRLWRMERGIDRHERSESYAIAARVIDRNMKRPIIIAAGADRAGIAGAVKALTTATTMESLLQNAPADWANMNFEAVIEDPIVDGNAESPRVVAKYFWK